jgi:hypothetical protein
MQSRSAVAPSRAGAPRRGLWRAGARRAPAVVRATGESSLFFSPHLRPHPSTRAPPIARSRARAMPRPHLAMPLRLSPTAAIDRSDRACARRERDTGRTWRPRSVGGFRPARRRRALRPALSLPSQPKTHLLASPKPHHHHPNPHSLPPRLPSRRWRPERRGRRIRPCRLHRRHLRRPRQPQARRL